MKGIILILLLFATTVTWAQELEETTIKGKKVKIEKVYKKYVKGEKLYAAEYRFLKNHLRANQYDSLKIIELLGQPSKVEKNNGQTVLIYDCYVNYEVAGFWNWKERLSLYLDDKNRLAELKSSD